MNDRLAPLRFLPPPINTPWTGANDQTIQTTIKRVDGSTIAVALPLFWHDPHWCDMPTNQADALAVAIGELGVLVSAMRSDLSTPDRCPNFHGGSGDIVTSDETTETKPAVTFPRIVPYRPERYGLCARDFDGATVIDVRLVMPRDEAGRFAFTPDQIRRWEATPADESLAGGGWVPAATFPPDVISMKHLSHKFDQLRELSPAAAVFATIEPYRFEEDVPRLLAAKPDGVILRMDDMQLDGLQLARFVQLARQEMNATGSPDMPLWIVPGQVTADDVLKLIQLGATAVAIDAWCDDLIEEAEEATAGNSPNKFTDTTEAISIDSQYLRDLAKYRIGPKISRIIGLAFSLGRVAKADRLGTFDATWASELGVKELG